MLLVEVNLEALETFQFFHYIQQNWWALERGIILSNNKEHIQKIEGYKDYTDRVASKNSLNEKPIHSLMQ